MTDGFTRSARRFTKHHEEVQAHHRDTETPRGAKILNAKGAKVREEISKLAISE